jgi:hypothetical protein
MRMERTHKAQAMQSIRRPFSVFLRDQETRITSCGGSRCIPEWTLHTDNRAFPEEAIVQNDELPTLRSRRLPHPTTVCTATTTCHARLRDVPACPS